MYSYTHTWLRLSSIIPPEELQKRLKDYWMLIANISGLTSGFAYVVASSEINFGEAKVGIAKRKDIFGFLITTSFVLSLGSTLLAALLYASVNILGPEGTIAFVQQFYWLCGKPLTLCLFGVLLMFLSQLPTIATLYSEWMYIYALIIGITVVIISGCLYLKVQKAMIKMMDEKVVTSHRELDLAPAGDKTDNTNNNEDIGIKYA